MLVKPKPVNVPDSRTSVTSAPLSPPILRANTHCSRKNHFWMPRRGVAFKQVAFRCPLTDPRMLSSVELIFPNLYLSPNLLQIGQDRDSASRKINVIKAGNDQQTMRPHTGRRFAVLLCHTLILSARHRFHLEKFRASKRRLSASRNKKQRRLCEAPFFEAKQPTSGILVAFVNDAHLTRYEPRRCT